MSANFLVRSRHKSVYYFRRRIPIDLKHHFSSHIVIKSLDTTCKKIAVILARNLASQSDRLFEQLRAKTMKSSDLLNLTLRVDLDKNRQLTGFQVDAEPHEEALAKSVISAVLNANQASHASIPSTSQVIPQPLTQSFQSFVDEYYLKAGLKANTIASYKSKFQFAKAYFGPDSDVLSIDQLGVVHFSEHVKNKIGNKTTQGLYIQIVVTFINWHRARNGFTPLSSKTLIPKRTTPEYEDREEFTLSDIRLIFENAFSYSRKEPHKWWATVAVAFLGCRIEEICQVNLETDLIHDKENNIWYFQLNEKPDSDGVVRKSLKKLASHRRIPIHSALIKYGFIDYLNRQKQLKATRPFERGWVPRIVPKDRIYKWSQYATKWGGRQLDELDEKGLLKKGDKTYFHSMRHTFAKLMQESGVSNQISEAIAGRSAGVGEQERYGKIKENHKLLSHEGIEKALNPLVEILDSIMVRKPYHQLSSIS